MTARGSSDDGSEKPAASAVAAGSPIRVLTFSTLYPNAAQPQHGVFVENRLRHLVASGAVEATVLAPAPWFPFSHRAFGDYAKFARVPHEEVRHGLSVTHPRYVVVPKVGMSMAPSLLYLSARTVVRHWLAQGRRFDLIDAHYFYPDGVAAAMLGREFGLPVFITSRGADLNQIADYSLPRRQILWAASRAAGLVTVCQSLKDRLIALGAAGDKIEVLRNGVDLRQFTPVDRSLARRRWGVDGPLAVSVGALIPRKGHDLVIRAMAGLPGVHFLIAGQGPERAALEGLIVELGLGDRVKLIGQLAHEELSTLYSAADVSVLASSSEGWANVLLESMACGTPVAATNVSGTPEAVQGPEAGVLIEERTSVAIAAALRRLLDHPPARAATRAYAEGFSWDATTEGQLRLFSRALGRDFLPRAQMAPMLGRALP